MELGTPQQDILGDCERAGEGHLARRAPIWSVDG
jgi:hypothetical protein